MPEWFVAVPALVIGLTIGAYWYRVLRMARKARKKTGRAANLVPPEPLGRVLRMIWAPAIGLWIANPLLIGLMKSPPMLLRPLRFYPGVALPAAVLVLLGFIATRICWAKMGAAWRMGIDPGEQNTLVVSGPFAYVRHPIYALSCAMMIATMIALPSVVLLTAGVIHVLLLAWESWREEKHLLRVQGEPYRKYMARVGRFWPLSIRPYVPECNAPASAGVSQ